MDKLSTSQVAKRLGVLRPSLQRGIDEGRIPAPPLRKIGGIEMRLWSEADIARARNAMESGKWHLNRQKSTKKAKGKPK
jgi:excisionase family DNA binding protein